MFTIEEQNMYLERKKEGGGRERRREEFFKSLLSARLWMVWGKQPLSGPGLHFFYLHICMTSKSPITTRLPKTRQLDTKAQLKAVGENKG